MFEAFKRRAAAIEARPENRIEALRRELAVDAPVLSGSAEHARLLAVLAGPSGIDQGRPGPAGLPGQ